MHYPKITLMTPTLNAASTIEKTIQSVLAQDYPNIEYLIIDGGSSDGTQAILERYRDKIHYLGSHKDRGPTDAYNNCLPQVTGEWIGMLSADDWLEPNTLKSIAYAIQENPDADVISCYAQLVEEKDQGYNILKQWLKDDVALTLQSVLTCPVSNARFIRKRIFDNYGGFKPIDANGRFIIPSDTEFFIRIALRNVKNIIINHMGYTFLAHAQSLTNSRALGSNLKTYLQLLDVYDNYLSNVSMTHEQRQIFIHQYMKDSTLCFIYGIFTTNYRAGFNAAIKGIKLGKWLWFIYLIKTITRLTYKIVKKLF